MSLRLRSLRLRDVLDAEDGAGLVYIERSKTDQAGEGAYVAITPETLVALKQLRQSSGMMSDADASVFGLSMSQISRRVDGMARAAGLGEGYTSHSGRVGLAIRMTRRGAPLQAVQTHGRWKSPFNAGEVHQGREGARGAGVALIGISPRYREGTEEA